MGRGLPIEERFEVKVRNRSGYEIHSLAWDLCCRSFPSQSYASKLSIMERRQFRECLTVEEKMEWLRSDRGQQILSHRPRIKQMYDSGRIPMMLRDPHWSAQLDAWLNDSHPTQGNLHSHTPPEVSNTAMPFPRLSSAGLFRNPRLSKLDLAESDKLNFLIHGYVVLPQVVNERLQHEALQLIGDLSSSRDQSTANRGSHSHRGSSFVSDFTQEAAVMNLFYNTPLQRIVSTLLFGCEGDFAKDCAVLHQAQLALRLPDREDSSINRPSPLSRLASTVFGSLLPLASDASPASSPHPPLGGRRWHIDGLAQGRHSPFSLLVGVALSDQMDTYSGNLCVFPGAHHQILPFLREFVASGYLPAPDSASSGRRFQQGPPGVVGPAAFEAFAGKPDLGEPVQLLLRAGDVVLLHQKLPHRGGPNYSQNVRIMVYFRAHRHRTLPPANDAESDRSLHDLWFEFEGMQEVV